MRLSRFVVLIIVLLVCIGERAFSQPIPKDDFVLTKDGIRLTSKRLLIERCKKDMGASPDNKEAHRICACTVAQLDGYFTMKEIQKAERLHKVDGFDYLVKNDSVLQQRFTQCYEEWSKTNLLFSKQQIQRYKESMMESIRKSSKEELDEKKLGSYCDCAVGILKERKLTEQTFHDLSDPNSLIYNEIAYRCGGVPHKRASTTAAWNKGLVADIQGNKMIDSVKVLQIGAMTKLKVKIGSVVGIWMLDSGATDLLVSDSLVNRLLELNLLSKNDFLGNETYYLANGKPIKCDVYKINQVQVGNYTVNNLILAASKDTDEFLLGKSLLNKFSRWSIDNKNDILVLEK